MKKMVNYLTAAALIALPMSAQAAIAISNVTASSTFRTYNVVNLVNGSGLTGSLHNGEFENKWLSNAEPAPTLTFDLGSVYALWNTVIWNYGGGCCGTERNVNSFTILFSTDDITYTSFGTFSLTNSTMDSFTADTISLTGNARYVRFNVLSNQGDPDYTGLSEVQFNSLIAGAVPESSTWAMMIAGFGLVGAAARRRRHRVNVSFG